MAANVDETSMAADESDAVSGPRVWQYILSRE